MSENNSKSKKQLEMVLPPLPQESVRLNTSQTPKRKEKRRKETTMKTVILDSLNNLKVNIRAVQEKDKISYRKMKEAVARNHIKKIDGSTMQCGDICRFQTGSHGCFSSSKDSDFYKYGTGVSLYFKFIKSMINFFFICSLISVPSLVFNIKASIQSKQDLTNYKDYFTAVSLGSLSREIDKCETINGTLTNTLLFNKNLEFYCTNGILRNDSIQFGLISNSQFESEVNCDSVKQSSVDKSCNNDAYFFQEFNSKCNGQTTCQLKFSALLYQTSTACQQKLQNSQAFFQYICQETKFFGVQLKNLSYMYTLIDLAICFSFLIMIFKFFK